MGEKKRSVRIRVFFSVGVALFLIVLLVYMRENAREKLTYIERFAIAESELFGMVNYQKIIYL